MFVLWLGCFIAAEFGFFVYCIAKKPGGMTIFCGVFFIAIIYCIGNALGYIFAQASAGV